MRLLVKAIPLNLNYNLLQILKQTAVLLWTTSHSLKWPKAHESSSPIFLSNYGLKHLQHR